MTKIVTDYPVALTSIDNLYPYGTAADNSTSIEFIEEVENYFNKKIKFLDIGSSGGQLVVDFHNRGHLAIGIEGSDYSYKNKRGNWANYSDKNLFLCDASKPYKIISDDGNKIIFDCITSWEVIEHIQPSSLDTFFKNIYDHMSYESIFVGSISLVSDFHKLGLNCEEEVEYHPSVFTKDYWITNILSKLFIVQEYPFINKVRNEKDSFFIKLIKK